MKKFLKFIVIFMGVLIIILMSITILAIFNKYKIEDNKNFEILYLTPKIEDFYKIKDYFIVDNQIHLRLENTKNNVQIVKVYNFKTGNLLKEIELK